VLIPRAASGEGIVSRKAAASRTVNRRSAGELSRKNLSSALLAVAVAIELICLINVERHANRFSISIASTELWRNPWPGPGDQTRVAEDR
jgi:hypothetical protein